MNNAVASLSLSWANPALRSLDASDRRATASVDLRS